MRDRMPKAPRAQLKRGRRNKDEMLRIKRALMDFVDVNPMLSMQQYADRFGVSQTTVSKWFKQDGISKWFTERG